MFHRQAQLGIEWLGGNQTRRCYYRSRCNRWLLRRFRKLGKGCNRKEMVKGSGQVRAEDQFESADDAIGGKFLNLGPASGTGIGGAGQQLGIS